MPRHLQRAIDKLMEELHGLSAWVEENVKRAIQALEERDGDLARRVKKEDEAIDKKEMEIEEECLKIFALHQPVAIDLRYLVAILKITNDLERIGDLALNIAKAVIRIVENPLIIKHRDFRSIYSKVREMVKMSIDALVKLDLKTAQDVLEADNEVDRLNRLLYNEVIEDIKKTPQYVEVLIQYIHIVRHLERIADHATNISEDVIYLISGEIARHGQASSSISQLENNTPGSST